MAVGLKRSNNRKELLLLTTAYAWNRWLYKFLNVLAERLVASPRCMFEWLHGSLHTSRRTKLFKDCKAISQQSFHSSTASYEVYPKCVDRSLPFLRYHNLFASVLGNSVK